LLFVFALDAPAVTAVTLFAFKNLSWTQLTVYAENPEIQDSSRRLHCGSFRLKIR
jgi:hypothetical protein